MIHPLAVPCLIAETHDTHCACSAGIASFWRGNLANVIRYFPTQARLLRAYGAAQRCVAGLLQHSKHMFTPF